MSTKPGLSGMSGAGLLVVGTLCAALLLSLVTLCAFVLLRPGQDVPDALTNLLTGLVPAVSALLAKTYADARGVGEDEPVKVTADDSLPVHVEDDGQWREPLAPQ